MHAGMLDLENIPALHCTALIEPAMHCKCLAHIAKYRRSAKKLYKMQDECERTMCRIEEERERLMLKCKTHACQGGKVLEECEINMPNTR